MKCSDFLANGIPVFFFQRLFLFQVTDEEVEAFKKQFNFPYFETSAKTRHNVEEAFEKLIQETAKKFFKRPPNSGDQSDSRIMRTDGRKKKRISVKNGAKCLIS